MKKTFKPKLGLPIQHSTPNIQVPAGERLCLSTSALEVEC